MFRYRFQLQGQSAGMPDEDARVFSNDLDALDHARQLADRHSVEIWEGERRVARVKPGDAGPTRFDKDPN